MNQAIFSPKARQDILQAIDWISKDNPVAAQAFRNALQRAAQNLGTYPFAGRKRADLVHYPCRFLAIIGFPYLLVYDPIPVPPLVLRMLHSARDLPEILGDLGQEEVEAEP